MKRKGFAAAAAALALAAGGSVLAVALTAGGSGAAANPQPVAAFAATGQPVAAISGFMKGFETLSWAPVAGAPGYDLFADGTKVSNAGPGATSARFQVSAGQHTLQVVPQDTPAPAPTTTVATTTTPATTTAPTTTVAPPPPAANPLGVIRLGADFATATGYDRYGTVICGVSDADKCAALPSTVKRLVYMSAIDLPTFFAGVNYQEALTNGYTLTPETAAGSYLLDPGNVGYQQAFVKEVGDFLRLHHLDGFYLDDVVVDPRSLTACNCWPAKYANGQGWVTAVLSFVKAIGPALKAQGFYVGANAVAYFPGNVGAWPGTDSNTGTSDQEWVRELAPNLSFVMEEQFQRPNGIRRSSSTTQWPGYWSGFQPVEMVAQAAGADFYGTVNVAAGADAEIEYAYGSLLLDWNGAGGGVLVFGPGDPWNAATWARIPGAALEAKTLVGQVWRRQFANLTVYVNPTLTAQTADGISVPPTSAVFK